MARTVRRVNAVFPNSDESVMDREFRRSLRHRTKVFKQQGLPVADLRRLLREGHVFIGARPVREDEGMRALLRTRRPRPQQCFANAQRTVLRDESGYATYCEGYVLSAGLLIHHAWLVVRETVFDPTLEAAHRAEVRAGQSRDDARQRAYFGVQFTRDEVNRSFLRERAYTSVLRI